MKDRSVLPGDELEIGARVWNDLLDIRERDRMRRLNSGGVDEHKGRQSTIIKVKNSSGDDRGRFTVLGLDGPHVHPKDLELSFKDRPALIGVIPTKEHRHKFCILLEPIVKDRTGRAIMAGVTVARVERTDTEYACAEPIKDVHDRLRNVPHGSATILWIDDFPEEAESDTATVWAIIRIDAFDREAHVKITSDAPDENGYYDGVVQEFDLDDLEWVDKYEVKVLDIDDDLS